MGNVIFAALPARKMMSITRLLRLIGIVVLLLLLAACEGGAVVFAPTPAPPDLSPMLYRHPDGVFTLAVPRNWTVYSQNTSTLASATFFLPDTNQVLLTAAVINLGQQLDDSQMRQLMLDYETQIRPDAAHFVESDRQPMSDGSWRLTGMRAIPGMAGQQINTFIQRQGTDIGLIEVVIPDDVALAVQLQAVVNTFQIDPSAALQPAPLSTLSAVTTAGLQILHLSTWTTAAGVFYITGEVANYTGAPVMNVPIRAVLWAADGTGIAEAVDSVMGYTIPPGGFGPFSLRFGQGQPPETVTYSVNVGGDDWQPDAVSPVIGQESLTWTDSTQYNQNNQLVVTGQITNSGDQAVRDVRAVVTVFDANRSVIAAGYADASRARIPPGETADYNILVPDIGGTPANYIVTVQGLPDQRNSQ